MPVEIPGQPLGLGGRDHIDGELREPGRAPRTSSPSTAGRKDCRRQRSSPPCRGGTAPPARSSIPSRSRIAMSAMPTARLRSGSSTATYSAVRSPGATLTPSASMPRSRRSWTRERPFVSLADDRHEAGLDAEPRQIGRDISGDTAERRGARARVRGAGSDPIERHIFAIDRRASEADDPARASEAPLGCLRRRCRLLALPIQPLCRDKACGKGKQGSCSIRRLVKAGCTRAVRSANAVPLYGASPEQGL